MATDKKKKIALVRCDTHAYWFGVFMEDYDIQALATHDESAPERTAAQRKDSGVALFTRSPVISTASGE